MRLATRVYLKYSLAKTLNMPLRNGCKPVVSLAATQLIYNLHFNEITSDVEMEDVSAVKRRVFVDCLNWSFVWAKTMRKTSPVTRGSDRV